MNARINPAVQVIDLGRVEYTRAWEIQTEYFQSILDVKKRNRELPDDAQVETRNYMLLCEHPAVVTLGKSGDQKNLLATPDELRARGATYVHTNRGGDITFHGPGQLVVYPVIDLENFFTDINRYMRSLEEAVIRTLRRHTLEGSRIPGLTGVWISDSGPARKICAMGVKTSRWVTMHGLALNANVDLAYFDLIVPCGIGEKEVTSMKKERGREIDMEQLKKQLTGDLVDVFGMTVQA